MAKDSLKTQENDDRKALALVKQRVTYGNYVLNSNIVSKDATCHFHDHLPHRTDVVCLRLSSDQMIFSQSSVMCGGRSAYYRKYDFTAISLPELYKTIEPLSSLPSKEVKKVVKNLLDKQILSMQNPPQLLFYGNDLLLFSGTVDSTVCLSFFYDSGDYRYEDSSHYVYKDFNSIPVDYSKAVFLGKYYSHKGDVRVFDASAGEEGRPTKLFQPKGSRETQCLEAIGSDGIEGVLDIKFSQSWHYGHLVDYAFRQCILYTTKRKFYLVDFDENSLLFSECDSLNILKLNVTQRLPVTDLPEDGIIQAITLYKLPNYYGMKTMFNYAGDHTIVFVTYEDDPEGHGAPILIVVKKSDKVDRVGNIAPPFDTTSFETPFNTTFIPLDIVSTPGQAFAILAVNSRCRMHGAENPPADDSIKGCFVLAIFVNTNYTSVSHSKCKKFDDLSYFSEAVAAALDDSEPDFKEKILAQHENDKLGLPPECFYNSISQEKHTEAGIDVLNTSAANISALNTTTAGIGALNTSTAKIGTSAASIGVLNTTVAGIGSLNNTDLETYTKVVWSLIPFVLLAFLGVCMYFSYKRGGRVYRVFDYLLHRNKPNSGIAFVEQDATSSNTSMCSLSSGYTNDGSDHACFILSIDQPSTEFQVNSDLECLLDNEIRETSI